MHCCVIPVENVQTRHSHVPARDSYGRDPRYKESTPDHDRQRLLAASRDIHIHHRQSTTPSSGNRSASAQHSAHEAMIHDQMV